MIYDIVWFYQRTMVLKWPSRSLSLMGTGILEHLLLSFNVNFKS